MAMRSDVIISVRWIFRTPLLDLPKNLKDRVKIIVFQATGVPGLIRPEMVKEGAVLIDVGFTRKLTTQGRFRLMGDVNPQCKEFASLMVKVRGVLNDS